MSLAVGTPSYKGQPSDDVETSTAKEIEKDITDGSRHSSYEHNNAEKGEMIQVSDYQDPDENENEKLILSHEEQFPLDPNAPRRNGAVHRSCGVRWLLSWWCHRSIQVGAFHVCECIIR